MPTANAAGLRASSACRRIPAMSWPGVTSASRRNDGSNERWTWAKPQKRVPHRLIAPRGHAAVDDDLGSRDEARLVGGEEQRRVGGVAAVPHEAERNARGALPDQERDVAA